MAEVGLLDIAQVYAAMGQLGMTPREADELYLWECAATLGVLQSPKTDDSRRPDASAENERHRRDLIAQRIAYAEGRGPKPKARAVSQQQLDAISSAVQ